ncbi:hypothetical protein [Pseudoalteromonas luteoviolacea]|uniref:Lipoprotein n=1 Tax=Pseudoalteromonas luteoviolacea NCIMB 1942 TaxID=1365253 RepID=A0A167ES08_9GAMM|nr:hypothetical protein [Pseudoalteromonas luteoviolacea]KZN51129.1 hypothetical protein N482_00550 [Pseudoalteromonas luteoviolacea NCIMB 1942]
MKIVPISILVALMAGCSSTSTDTRSSVDRNSNAKSGLICDREAVTGTRFTKKRCRTKEQIERDEDEAKEMLRTRGTSVGQQDG